MSDYKRKQFIMARRHRATHVIDTRDQHMTTRANSTRDTRNSTRHTKQRTRQRVTRVSQRDYAHEHHDDAQTMPHINTANK
jgi:hypothetical protein